MLRIHDDLSFFKSKNDFFKVGNTIKMAWSVLKTQKKKLFSVKIHNFDEPTYSNKEILGKCKHVTFADRLGLDLEMIHIKHANSPLNTNFPFKDSNEIKTHGEQQFQMEKIILPKFSLCSNICYRKLIKNGICLNSFEIYNNTSIRGIVLTLQNSSLHKLSEIKEFHAKNNEISYIGIESETNNNFNINLDLVYVIWSIDEWKSWKYQAAIQKNCKTNPKKGIIKTHEFFIQNLGNIIQITQRLKLIVCNQIGLVVFKDTNGEKSYRFDCAIKV
jgi:hypothetical protein